MWFSSLLTCPQPPKAVHGKTASTRLSIEALEDRAVPSASTAWGDFNNDGLTDRVAVTSSTNQVQVFLAQSDGTYLAATPAKTSSGPHDVVAGDFNNDGKLDALIATNVNTSLALGNGDGMFQGVSKVTDLTFGSLAVGDIDKDGDLDFLGERSIKAYSYGRQFVRHYAHVYLGGGNGQFTLLASYHLFAYENKLLGPELDQLEDMNGDGHLDVVDSSGRSVLYGKGDGRFSYYA